MNAKACIPALVVLAIQMVQSIGAADTQLSTGPAYVGTDPGGTEMLRVGGAVRVGGNAGIGGPPLNAGGYYDVTVNGSTNGSIVRLVGTGYDFKLQGMNGTTQVGSYNASVVQYMCNAAEMFRLDGSMKVATGVNLIVGADPGGSELLRVGGGISALGNIYERVMQTVSGSSKETRCGFLDAAGSGVGTMFGGMYIDPTTPSLTIEALEGGVAWRNIVLAKRGGAQVVVGPDPGGSELLRVGGDIRAANNVIAASTVFAGSTANTHQYIAMSSDDANKFSTVQAIQQNVAFTRLAINPLGGAVSVGVDPGGSELLRIGGALHAKQNASELQFSETASNPTLRLASSSNVYSDLVYNTMGADQCRLRGSTYGLAIGGTNARLNIGYPDANYAEALRVNGDARIGGVVVIGAKTDAANAAGAKMFVQGKIAVQEVVVTLLGNWSDYVFANGYQLPSLAEVAAYTKDNHHLPGIPSEAEIARDGLSAGDMLAKHMAKIEELTLYAIKADQRADALATENAALRDREAKLEARLDRLERALAAPAPAR